MIQDSAPSLLASAVLAGLALGACSSVDGGTQGLTAANTAPSPQAGFDWFHDSEANEASLVYGEANTDNIWLGLSCTRGAGRLDMFQPVGPGHAPVIRLESGGETESYPARAESSDLHDGPDLIASAPVGDPVFQRFRRVGWLAVLGEGTERALMVPHPQTAPAIERFFVFCGQT